ncbi:MULTISPECIES: hypothetical protein [Moorena]|uniref:Uncharacterized protein n=1 Tax=Moorena producens 3L TaxID=489825 RepID=F4XZP9_9CYAN|nr:MULTISPECIES: hypothetical protein [Moorena]EGJ29817.1 hypothetical protein LYNGBM3L_59220 [Moorena producens 3L]NEP66727.1 hypothetical protein [Moorena sp. SIO3A5]NER91824.1 hypothetical protein [Moorena sp. SIO3A2]OLT66379.1 hypothetical protein BI334_16385 [Moorena producens 3L]
MISSPLQKFVFRPALISATVFAGLTLPVGWFGAQPLSIKVQEEQLFYGHVRDAATPYLTLATVISLGAGMASVAIAGWQQSAQQSSQLQSQLSDLAQQSQKKEELLEKLRLSESQQNLTQHKPLENQIENQIDNQIDNQKLPQQPINYTVYTSSSFQSNREPLVTKTRSREYQPVAKSAVKGPAKTVEYMGLTYGHATRLTYGHATRLTYGHATRTHPGVGNGQTHTGFQSYSEVTSLPSEDIQQLQSQLQQAKAQMEAMQKVLHNKHFVLLEH